mgnify:CR=1 FL=1
MYVLESVMKFVKRILIFIIAFVGISCDAESNPNSIVFFTDDPFVNENSEYIIVLGDIQEYTNEEAYYPYFQATMEWIWNKIKDGKNIKCVLQTGDITWTNQHYQYNIFYKYTYPVALEIPYISCPGNHDYSYSNGYIKNRYSTLFSQYTSFDNVNQLVVDRYEEGRMENIIVKNEINGERIDIVSLEYGARTEVIEWAKQHIRNNPDIRYIILTHEFLTSKGKIIQDQESYAYIDLARGESTYSGPVYIWNNLIKDNNNIVCVLCGHHGFSAHLFTKNSFGREVPQILFNLQYQDNGGDGWVQLWEFPKNSDFANVNTYNTITREYHPDSNHSFKFKYKI